MERLIILVIRLNWIFDLSYALTRPQRATGLMREWGWLSQASTHAAEMTRAAVKRVIFKSLPIRTVKITSEGLENAITCHWPSIHGHSSTSQHRSSVHAISWLSVLIWFKTRLRTPPKLRERLRNNSMNSRKCSPSSFSNGPSTTLKLFPESNGVFVTHVPACLQKWRLSIRHLFDMVNDHKNVLRRTTRIQNREKPDWLVLTCNSQPAFHLTRSRQPKATWGLPCRWTHHCKHSSRTFTENIPSALIKLLKDSRARADEPFPESCASGNVQAGLRRRVAWGRHAGQQPDVVAAGMGLLLCHLHNWAQSLERSGGCQAWSWRNNDPLPKKQRANSWNSQGSVTSSDEIPVLAFLFFFQQGSQGLFRVLSKTLSKTIRLDPIGIEW